MGDIWDKPDLKRPFEIQFSIDQLIGAIGASVSAASTAPITDRDQASSR